MCVCVCVCVCVCGISVFRIIVRYNERKKYLLLYSRCASQMAVSPYLHVIPVFEQTKPVLIAAVSLICMILNLVHH